MLTHGFTIDIRHKGQRAVVEWFKLELLLLMGKIQPSFPREGDSGGGMKSFSWSFMLLLDEILVVAGDDDEEEEEEDTERGGKGKDERFHEEKLPSTIDSPKS